MPWGLQMTVEAAKIKLSSHCGTPASDMVLQLKDGAGALVATLLESQRKLGFFSPQDGCAQALTPEHMHACELANMHACRTPHAGSMRQARHMCWSASRRMVPENPGAHHQEASPLTGPKLGPQGCMVGHSGRQDIRSVPAGADVVRITWCRWVLHVADTNPNSLSARGWLEDTSKVQKYVMSDAEYDARENTYRKYKEAKLQASSLPLVASPRHRLTLVVPWWACWPMLAMHAAVPQCINVCIPR